MRRLTAVVAAGVFVLAACGDDDEPEGLSVEDVQEAVDDAPACEDLYAEGNVLEAEQHQEPCVDEGGEAVFVPTMSQECGDGRTLLWNERAWWFEGEPVTPHDASDASEPPGSAYRECGA